MVAYLAICLSLFCSYNKLSNFIGSTSVLGCTIFIFGLLCMYLKYINKADPTNKETKAINTASFLN